jgi:hypothetical protein
MLRVVGPLSLVSLLNLTNLSVLMLEILGQFWHEDPNMKKHGTSSSCQEITNHLFRMKKSESYDLVDVLIHSETKRATL